MKGIIKNIINISMLLTVAQAGWDEYAKELQSLDFQNSSAFKKHMQHKISMTEALQLSPFPCEPYQLENKTTSVHYLRPGDINVVGAMGDSITAGNGIRALTVFGSLVQFRGYSWDVGGQSSYENNAMSLPNILKQYTSELKGYSVGVGEQSSENARCNVASPGKRASDMPDQAKLLVERLKALEGSSFQEDWKVITIFIGGNDLCDYCNDPDFYSPQNYTKYISEALDILAANVPKAFVNVVSLLDLSTLGELKGGIICELLHWKLCRCVVDETARPVVHETMKEYTNHLEKLITSGRYDTRDDFTVVLQPFLKNQDVPRLESGEGDLSYFAYDCFHFNQKGHNSLATSLWNAMFEPVGQKSTKVGFASVLHCPKKDEPFATAKNSINSMTHQPRTQENETKKTIKTQRVNNQKQEIQDGDQSHDSVQNGGNHLLGIMILTVLSIAAIGYGTFFLFKWRMNARSTAADRLRNALVEFKPSTSYQSI